LTGLGGLDVLREVLRIVVLVVHTLRAHRESLIEVGDCDGSWETVHIVIDQVHVPALAEVGKRDVKFELLPIGNGIVGHTD
jgi:hypothetical protein